MFSILRSMWIVFLHMFHKRETVLYPEQKNKLTTRWRGRIVLTRCIFCGYCEEACPTYAIQLIPDFEMGEYNRQNLVYEKSDLLIDGPGKYAGYNYYNVAGIAIGGKDKGQAENEEPPVDIKSLIP